MAADMRISNVVAAIMCNGIVDQIDNGTAGTGKCEIRTGAPPATVETAASGTLLTSINFQNPAFGAAADQAPGSQAAVLGTPSNTSATAAGTAGHYRTYDRVTTPVGVWQDTAGAAASGEGMELSNVNIALGQAVSITTMTVLQPET